MRTTGRKLIEKPSTFAPAEQLKVVESILGAAHKRQLTGDELAVLAQRLVESDNPAEIKRLRSALMRGFYGE